MPDFALIISIFTPAAIAAGVAIIAIFGTLVVAKVALVGGRRVLASITAGSSPAPEVADVTRGAWSGGYAPSYDEYRLENNQKQFADEGSAYAYENGHYDRDSDTWEGEEPDPHEHPDSTMIRWGK